MATIYLIRHCESEGNACRRAQAYMDAPVTRMGYDQCEALRKHFENTHLDAIYASDTFRAVKTVEPMAKERGLPVRVRFMLREICTGIWEDMSWGNIAADYPEEHRIWQQRPAELITPGINSFQELSGRMICALRRIAKEIGPDGVAAVASHSCSIKAALCGIYGWPFERVLECGHGENCSHSKLHVDESGNITVEYAHQSSSMPRNLIKSWQGIPSADVNLALYPCDLSKDKESLLALAESDAAERSESFDAAAFLAEAEKVLASDPEAIGLGYLHNQAVGYVISADDEKLPEGWGLIRRMYVIPELQGKGHGDQLYGYAAHHMRYAGKTVVAVPKDITKEEKRIVDRFMFEADAQYPEYCSMALFCPKLDYPVLP